MKHLFVVLIFLGACTATPPAKQYLSFGEAIDDSKSISLSSLNELMVEADTAEVKFTATIGAVCQMKGCWMTIANENGDDIRVTFKDYGFFVPKDAAGKEVVVRGIATRKQLSPDEAEHYAEDEGKPFDPEKSYIEIAVVADGVLIAEKQ